MRLIDAEALDKARIDYIVSGYANDPEDCSEFGMMIIKAPTVCDIEQIRAEIEKHTDGNNHCDEYLDGYNNGMKDALDIINEYTKGENK